MKKIFYRPVNQTIVITQRQWQKVHANRYALFCINAITISGLLAQYLSQLTWELILNFAKKFWQAQKKMLHWHRKSETILFIREFIKSPKTVGAVYPSSKKLAKQMAKQVVLDKNDVVIELGAGTGKVTEELLKKVSSPSQLIVIECSTEMVNSLRKKYPEINIIQGDAAKLVELLDAHKIQQARYIVSGLPFRSLPPRTAIKIIQQIATILQKDGKLIQFTYDLRKKQSPLFKHFTKSHSKNVWLNIPPAQVDTFSLKTN